MAENLCIKKSAVECVLECPLCLHQLTLPHTLPQCLHSYCKSCLDKVPQKTQDGHQGWLCPMCENFTMCEQTEKNTFIEELQKIHNELGNCDEVKCEQCLEDCGPAAWKCAQCKIGLCEIGKALHLKIPMLKGHMVLPLDSKDEKVIDNVLFCKVHADIPAQLNCRDCDQMICFKCNITDHKHHNAETVEEALERKLPETESSARQVGENISIIEAQIQRVNTEMDQTRESYASCRMQMDEHLEMMISRMRAMQAQMEEDVNEQESIALDTLRKLKRQLEKQLSEARIMSNLAAVVTTKSRHTSQLQQLQNGLFQKVKSAGEVKKQSLSFHLPATNFVEGQRFKKDIDKVFGKLAFNMKEQIISIAGESYTKPNQFLCSNFDKLAKTQFKKDKEIDVDAYWCNRLSHIDNQIWLPLDSSNAINIYDEDGGLNNVINTGDRFITVVKKAYNGDVICAGESGLFVTDTQFSKWTKLSEGTFCDVVVDNDQFIALQYDDQIVHTYVLKALNGHENSWRESHSFIVSTDIRVNRGSIICILDEEYLIISSKYQGIYKLSWGGECLDSCKDLNPVICGTDKNKQVLVAEFTKGTLYLFKPLLEMEIQRTAILSDVHSPQTRSLIIDQKHNLWVLAGDLDDLKLIRFASEQ